MDEPRNPATEDSGRQGSYTLDNHERCEPKLTFFDIPVELILEVLCLASASSQSTYKSLLLVSRQFYGIVQTNCLQAVPITLDGYEQLASFENFIRATPEVQDYVRFLWIMGHGLTCWGLIHSILELSTGIVSLSCTTRSLTSICSSLAFKHTQCTDLTLVETWHAWNDVLETPHGARLCAQVTRLRLHEGLSPEFPKQHFTALTHIAFSSRPIQEYIERHLAALRPLRGLRQIVVTTFWWRDEAPDSGTSKLLDLDGRLSILHCRRNWTELVAWQARVRGGFDLWEQARLERKSMHVFRGAFKMVRPRS
ncbi:hypothetical protein BDZ94DRAFT_303681 [Collybia nuda]|uniref:F-box domain-containing protein n=1 Tax=Collybia nuda TaxID=64659 RepID=A0A9P5YC75_9AGAR|nr:hypothetical protein BDZ94DRAFT_303681 [Collybia nuda]